MAGNTYKYLQLENILDGLVDSEMCSVRNMLFVLVNFDMCRSTFGVYF